MPRWDPGRPPEDLLGVVVHGPAVLAASTGITAGLRSVYAYPTGLQLALVLRAEGVQAEAAGRQGHAGQHWSELEVEVSLDGRAGEVHPMQSSAGYDDDHYRSEHDYWIPALPTDGQIMVTIGWPQAGLAETTTTLALDDLADLESRVVPFG